MHTQGVLVPVVLPDPQWVLVHKTQDRTTDEMHFIVHPHCDFAQVVIHKAPRANKHFASPYALLSSLSSVILRLMTY